MIDSCDKGVCKKCGKIKDFSPKIVLTKAEKKALFLPFNHWFYSQGEKICQER